MENEFGVITDLEYAAIEPIHDRIRLAYQPRESELHDTNVYIIGFYDDDSYSIPYSMSSFGILYNDKMEEMKLNEEEMTWLESIKCFAAELSRKAEPA